MHMSTPRVFWINTDEWFEGSFEIRLRPEVDVKTMRLMRTRGQYCGNSTICVPSGRARDTACGMLEFRDCFGMPFGWSKQLIDAVVAETGQILWFS
jgi:hypothetical protein